MRNTGLYLVILTLMLEVLAQPAESFINPSSRNIPDSREYEDATEYFTYAGDVKEPSARMRNNLHYETYNVKSNKPCRSKPNDSTYSRGIGWGNGNEDDIKNFLSAFLMELQIFFKNKYSGQKAKYKNSI